MRIEATKQEMISALYALVNKRPGLEPGNYSDWASYRADGREATRNGHAARMLIRQVELHGGIAERNLLDQAQSGRVSFYRNKKGELRAEYTAGQYWCVEYRPAVARFCASLLWDAAREGRTTGDEIRAYFKRAYGRTIQKRFFD